MFKKKISEIESAFRQLAEAQQQIDASARKVVESIQRMVDTRPDESPSTRGALPGHDFSWYEATARTLASEGFGTPEAFEPTAWLTRPIESRVLSEYALGDAGTVVAWWFLFPAKDGRPERRVIAFASTSEDGHVFETAQNATPSGLPLLPTEDDECVGAELSLLDVLHRHRARVARHGMPLRAMASVAAYHADRARHSERRARFRCEQGLGLVERYIQSRFQGDRREVGDAYIASIRAHPEWYAYANTGISHPDDARTPSAAATGQEAPGMPLNFLMSATDEGRRTLTTFGMLFAGLPELLLRDLAANHCRAGRFVLGTVARAIARRRSEIADDGVFRSELVSARGARLIVTGRDAVTPEQASQGSTPESSAQVVVHVSLTGFTPDDEPSLLSVDPLPGSDPLDERLRAACRQLGCDVPVARLADSFDAAMQDAHERALARLPDVKRRFLAGLGADEKLWVKIRVVEGEVGEYVWLNVNGWHDRELATEVVTPAPRVRLAARQPVTIEEGQIFDQLIGGAARVDLPSTTDRVAEDYGHDV